MKHLSTGPKQAVGATTPETPAQPPSGLLGDLEPPADPPAPAPGPQAPANAEAFRVQIAARIKPLEEVRSSSPVAVAVKEGATEAALNAVGILRDLWADVRSSDRWFKYKVGIVGAWLLLSAAAVYVAYPRDPNAPKNTIKARLVKSKVVDSPVFMIVNESGEPWKDVVIEVNYAYRAAISQVSSEHPENAINLETPKLRTEGGSAAPADLQIVQLHVRTAGGDAELIVNGKDVE
jgi:hypothetical protein